MVVAAVIIGIAANRDAVLAGSGFPYDLEILFGVEQCAQPRAEHGVVVYQKDADEIAHAVGEIVISRPPGNAHNFGATSQKGKSRRDYPEVRSRLTRATS